MRQSNSNENETSRPPAGMGVTEPQPTAPTFTHSAEIGEIGAAMAVAQGKLKNPTRTLEGQIGNQAFKYADPAETMEHILSVLSPLGVALLQFQHGTGWVFTVTTMLIHSSGEWMRSDWTVQSIATRGTEVQAAGLTIAYITKYAATSAVGLKQSDLDPDQQDIDEKEILDFKSAKNRIADHVHCVFDNHSSVVCIQNGMQSFLIDGEQRGLDEAVEAYYELDEKTRHRLHLAPTKGGVWTTQEYALFKQDPWSHARNEFYGLSEKGK